MDSFKQTIIINALKEILEHKFGGDINLMLEDMMLKYAEDEEYIKAAAIRDVLKEIEI